MRLDPVTTAQIEDHKIVGLVDREDSAADTDFPTRDRAPLLFIFELRRTLSNSLHFFGKETFFPLRSVKLLAGVIELGLQLDGRRCTGIDRGRMPFFDLLL